MFKNFKIYIIVANNRDKTHMFSVEERKKMIKSTFKNEKLNVIEFDGIISNYINKNNIDIIIRGIRNYTDFEYEKNIELFTKKTTSAETIYLTPRIKHSSTSSSVVRNFIKFGYLKKIKKLTSKNVYKIIKKKYK